VKIFFKVKKYEPNINKKTKIIITIKSFSRAFNLINLFFLLNIKIFIILFYPNNNLIVKLIKLCCGRKIEINLSMIIEYKNSVLIIS